MKSPHPCRVPTALGVLLLAFTLGAASPLLARRAVVIQADFGGAVMPGVAFNVSPDLAIFTIQPLIPLYDIDAAARSLSTTAPVWPAGTVFVSVVDPGVGTQRKSVVLETKSGHFFVSPDNGTLALVAAELGIAAVREIDERVNRRPGTEWSHTFHGRDVYSYTAARLAAGVISFEQVGPLLPAAVVPLDQPAPTVADGVATGMIYVSRGLLGNTACLIDRATFARLGVAEGTPVEITIRKSGAVVWQKILPFVRTFGDVPVGDELAFINSSGYLSLAINQGNFAEAHAIDSGRAWTLAVRKP